MTGKKGFVFRTIVIALLTFLVTNVNLAQSPSEIGDEELVRIAVEDYLLALYDVEPERIQRSVDTTLRKIGYYDYNGEDYFHAPMTYQQLYQLAGKWNKSGNQIDENTPRKIEIYEVHDRTASAKLTAKWGIDFMHLSKNSEGKWKILNIMWQSPPKK